MGHFLPSPQQLLVFVVERGATFIPVVIVLSLLGAVWSFRRRKRVIRYVAGGLLALIALSTSAALVFAYSVRGDLRQRTVDLRFRTLDDARTHGVADWRGKVVVVNYWATWCAPCRQELPDLSRLAFDHRDQPVVVITLTNESSDVVERWGDPSLRQTVRGVFADDAPEGGLAGVVLQWRPVTLVLDRRSTLRDVFLGPQTYATLERAVRDAL
jgi:thiol-disulfide isomerase/thioredoxin